MTEFVESVHEGACREAPDGTHSSVLLVGEDNPLSSHPSYALINFPARCAGWNMCFKILGMTEESYPALWRTNLCTPGWNKKQARMRAIELARSDHPWKLIVMLGRKVAEAFSVWTGGVALEPFTHQYVGDGEDDVVELRRPTLLSLPHPSGRNLVWNDPQCVQTARNLMDKLSAWHGFDWRTQ